jgi:hypothetical protein
VFAKHPLDPNVPTSWKTLPNDNFPIWVADLILLSVDSTFSGKITCFLFGKIFASKFLAFWTPIDGSVFGKSNRPSAELRNNGQGTPLDDRALLLVQYIIGWLMPDIHRGM